MRAAVYHGPGDVRIESRPIPRPARDEVLIRVLRAGICGTDASEYVLGPSMIPLRQRNPYSGHEGPLIIGHEFHGQVVDAGAEARHLIGSHLASGAGVSCGTCRWCVKGETNLCASYWTLGLNADGGLAEFAAVPASICVEVPSACSDDSAGLAQPLAVGLHAARRVSSQDADTVVLVGSGAIGSFILCGLRSQRIPRVIALDVDGERLKMASALGADEVHNVATQDPVSLIRDLTDGDGAEVVVEATGAPGATNRALQMTARGGRVLIVGLPHQPEPIDLRMAVLREISMATSVAHVCGQDLPGALRLLTDGAIASVVLEAVIGLEDLIADGLEAIVSRKARGKILVSPSR